MGIDVGGTKILLQTFDKNMNVMKEVKIYTETKKGQKGFTDQLFGLISEYLEASIKTIGIALPGIVNHEKGILVKAPHLPTQKNFPLKKLVEEKFKRKVYVDNDVKAFLWAEKDRPALKKYKNIVAVMVGTGLGGAILNDGQLVYGASGYAGEVGHMVLRQDGKLKTLEQNTSGHYVIEIAKAIKSKGETTEDPQIKKHILEHLGIGLSNLNLIFNPEVFVLGGSIYHFHLAKNKKQLEKMVAERALDKKSPKIIEADKKTSVARGMAMLALTTM